MHNYSKEVSASYLFNGPKNDPVRRISHIFQIPSEPQKHIHTVDHTLRFIRTNCTLLEPFLDKLIGNPQQTGNYVPPTVAIVNLTKKIMKKIEEK